ncbi:hypothetical protein BJX96DRAFT_164215 [Aspergillus floccosus]
MSLEAEVAHFNSIPWVANFLRDDSYTLIPTRTHHKKESLKSEDSFFTKALNTPTTISACIMQVKPPQSNRPKPPNPSPSRITPAEEIRAFFTVGEDIMGPPGAMHGGAVASILDQVLGQLLMAGGHCGGVVDHAEQQFEGPVTAYLNTTYVRRVPAPGTVVVYGRLKEAIEDRKWKVEGEIRDSEGRVLSRAECLFVKTTMASPLEGFLPAQAPNGATSHRIDFLTSSPPLPEYKNLSAIIIDNVITETECKELIRLAESSTPTWTRATISGGNGKQILATEERNCGRIIYDNRTLADKLLARLLPFLQEHSIDRIENAPLVTGLAGRKKTYRLTQLNERLRFLRYQGGEYFRPHSDAHYTTPGGREKSFYTVHLYLNGEGEQDAEELRQAEIRVGEQGDVNLDVEGMLLGGATSFMPRFEEQKRLLRVFPKTGSVLVFQQKSLLHGGDPVFRGTKYTMRTDIMYGQE